MGLNLPYGELPGIETEDGKKIPGIAVVIHYPPKTAVLRLPTSQEVYAYHSSLKSIVRYLGQGVRRDEEVKNEEAERKLFDALRMDKGEPFDETEVQKAINLATRCDNDPYEREGDEFIVKVRTLWGVTAHRVRMPSTRELQMFRLGAVRSRDLRHGAEERRFPPDAPINFYNAIILSVDGYAPKLNILAGSTNGDRHTYEGEELKGFLDQIPPHHKQQVAGEVSVAITDLDPQIDPNV